MPTTHKLPAVLALVTLAAATGLAGAQTGVPRLTTSDEPLKLQADMDSVYAPPAVGRDEEAVNRGGMTLDLSVAYSTDYIYRGIEVFPPPGGGDSANIQIDNRLTFDLGKYPHPFVGVYANFADQDPISRFQEIRPYFGAQLKVSPLMFEAGYNAYIYPDRDAMSTSEVYGKITFDDSALWGTDRPVFSPYIYAAYDFDLYNAWYFEAGLEHQIAFETLPLTLTFYGHVAYVMGYELYSAVPGRDTGFQHWQVGMIADYSLNTALNIPKRLGSWSVYGFVNYTDGIDNDLRATTQLWGGAGIRLQY